MNTSNQMATVFEFSFNINNVAPWHHDNDYTEKGRLPKLDPMIYKNQIKVYRNVKSLESVLPEVYKMYLLNVFHSTTLGSVSPSSCKRCLFGFLKQNKKQNALFLCNRLSSAY